MCASRRGFAAMVPVVLLWVVCGLLPFAGTGPSYAAPTEAPAGQAATVEAQTRQGQAGQAQTAQAQVQAGQAQSAQAQAGQAQSAQAQAGQTRSAQAPARAPSDATLRFVNRDIVTFRATVLGYDPQRRVARTLDRIEALQIADLQQPVKTYHVEIGDIPGISVYVGDQRIFTLVGADLDPEGRHSLEKAAEEARARLAEAITVRLEQTRWPVLLAGIAHALAATLLIGAIFLVLRRIGHALRTWMLRRRDALADAGDGSAVQWREYLFGFLVQVLLLLRWLLMIVLGYAWLTYTLEHFPLTEPLGQHLVRFVVNLAVWLGEGVVDAAPGIATVAVIWFLTRAIVDALGRFFAGVQRGRTSVSFLHRETVTATRRIVTFVAWAFALVVAYPFIPGSDSDAFKGLSVLLGVMVSLGSTGLVNQLMSGLVIIYSRALRKGDFVVVDGVEGTVLEVGSLATKIVTMRNAEVTIPNSVLTGASIQNFSKLAGSQGTLLSTKVTIGYDAPWRQVHAMLELASGRTPGLRKEPKPFVYQRALSDFYAEYELFAHTDRPADRFLTLSRLHENIQDVFNENGVQIMSPHFVLQPREAVVVPPADWYPAPARAPGDEPRR